MVRHRKDRGKDITDPDANKAEVRGGEKPDDWTGPLAAEPATPMAPPPDVATPPGTAVTIAPGDDSR